MHFKWKLIYTTSIYSLHCFSICFPTFLSFPPLYIELNQLIVRARPVISYHLAISRYHLLLQARFTRNSWSSSKHTRSMLKEEKGETKKVQTQTWKHLRKGAENVGRLDPLRFSEYCHTDPSLQPPNGWSKKLPMLNSLLITGYHTLFISDTVSKDHYLKRNKLDSCWP